MASEAGHNSFNQSHLQPILYGGILHEITLLLCGLFNVLTTNNEITRQC